MAFQRAGAGVTAGQLVDGAVLQGDGTFTYPDGTVQRPGIEKFTHGEIAAGVQIAHGASKAAIILIDITETSGVGVTMSAAPSIEPGTFDGQLCIIRTLETANALVQVTDEGATPGTKVRLGATPEGLGNARDSHAFIWRAAVSEWWSTLGRRNNIL